MGTENQTDFLVPSSSFVVGMGSVMNIGGGYFEYNNSSSANKADARAIRSDWYNVGKDFCKACEEEYAELEETLV